MKPLHLAYLCAALLLLTGISLRAGVQNENDLSSRVIRVRGDQFYPPFEFINEKGEPDGFNVELIKAIAREYNLNVEIDLVPWSRAIDDVEKGEADMLLGLMISPQRASRMRFSVPHSVMTHGIFTRKNSPVKTLEDLRGKEIIVQKSDRMHEYLIESGITTKIVLTTSQRQALVFLNEGNHDAALIGNFQGLHLMRELKLNNIELRSSGIEPQQYAMAVSMENDMLLALINNGLYQLKVNGQYDELYHKWFAVYEQNFFFRKNKHLIAGAGIFIILLAVSVALLRYRIYQTTKHLRESEARYRSIFQSKHTIMMLIDPQSGEIIDANAAAVNFYGWTRKQLCSMNISHINTLSQEEINLEMQRAWNARENMFRFRHRLANGDERQVEVHSGSIVLKKKQLLFSIIHDITEKAKAQEEIRNWQNLLQFIIMHAPNAIAVHDNSLRYVYVSDRFLKDYGIKESDILGRTPDEVLPQMAAKWEETYCRALQGEVIRSEEDQMLRHDGTSDTIRWECRPWFRPDGSTGGVILYSEVITERKRSEELRYNLEVARKTTQIKQTFLASISHEMRTPLNGIIGLSNHLSKTSLADEQKNYLNIILDSSATLLGLINQVLNLSKIESGHMPVVKEEININAFVQKLKNTFSFLFSEKGIKYSVEVSEGFPPTFIFDEKQLIQILTNLIGNSLKFTQKGEVKVLFENQVNSQGEDQLRVSVSDTGPGIDKEHHENIFLEFVQVHNSSDCYNSGTGLGLPISKKIVEAFGGKMGVDSHPGTGSTFWFTIIPSKVTQSPPEPVQKNENPSRLDLNVLLVEDKKVNRMVAELLLSEMGCTVENAENGKIAIEKVLTKKYDVILMDIQMPVMDGVTATRTLKAMKVPIPPIIGLSAEAMEGDAEKYIALGMDDYLTKPIDSGVIFNKLLSIKRKN